MLRAFSCEGERVREIVVTAPAKVNLHLGIGGVRPDGFHDVTTVLHTLEFADTLRLTPSESFTLTCDTDLGIPAEQNLALRAARLFSAQYREPAGVAIELTKRIPAGAGLGGGSSDAAAVLAGLAAMTAEGLAAGTGCSSKARYASAVLTGAAGFTRTTSTRSGGSIRTISSPRPDIRAAPPAKKNATSAPRS